MIGVALTILYRVQQASERARPKIKHFKQIHRLIFQKVQNFLSAGCLQGHPVVQLEDIQVRYILCLM
jgi:fido (protein-threonine AMPylation protein)